VCHQVVTNRLSTLLRQFLVQLRIAFG
jgi:hypothetical protein